MNKKFFAVLLISAAILLSGCTSTTVSQDEVKEGIISRFIIIEDNYSFDVVYDRHTKVMYAVAAYGSGSGQVTLLVDGNGDPLLYDPEEYE